VAPEISEPYVDFGIAKTRTDFLVELVDDVGRCIPRCAEAPVRSRGCVRRRVTPQIFCGAVIRHWRRFPPAPNWGRFFWYCGYQYGRAFSAHASRMGGNDLVEI
jgi:hypothetical protein